MGHNVPERIVKPKMVDSCGDFLFVPMRNVLKILLNMQKYFCELCLGVILGLGDSMYIIMYVERPIEHGNPVCVCVSELDS